MFLSVVIVACRNGKDKASADVQENLQAKQMLQGIWLDADEGVPSFRAKGDSIFYPDTISQPARFRIVADTLMIEGAYLVKYPIVRQSAHLFEFVNQNGETIKLVKSEDADDLHFFRMNRHVTLNQNKVIKRDSIVVLGSERYHLYVQVNPTTYKVVKPTYNDEGVEVDNVYYDNTIHLAVFNGASKVYSQDFKKQDFKLFVPEAYLRQSILSDITLVKADTDGFHHRAQLCIPDSPSSYVVEVLVSAKGKMTMKVME